MIHQTTVAERNIASAPTELVSSDEEEETVGEETLNTLIRRDNAEASQPFAFLQLQNISDAVVPATPGEHKIDDATRAPAGTLVELLVQQWTRIEDTAMLIDMRSAAEEENSDATAKSSPVFTASTIESAEIEVEEVDSGDSTTAAAQSVKWQDNAEARNSERRAPPRKSAPKPPVYSPVDIEDRSRHERTSRNLQEEQRASFSSDQSRSQPSKFPDLSSLTPSWSNLRRRRSASGYSALFFEMLFRDSHGIVGLPENVALLRDFTWNTSYFKGSNAQWLNFRLRDRVLFAKGAMMFAIPIKEYETWSFQGVARDLCGLFTFMTGDPHQVHTLGLSSRPDFKWFSDAAARGEMFIFQKSRPPGTRIRKHDREYWQPWNLETRPEWFESPKPSWHGRSVWSQNWGKATSGNGLTPDDYYFEVSFFFKGSLQH